MNFGSIVLPDVSQLLVIGGDARLTITAETYLNQYFVSPFPQDGIIRRGSCTCSNISSELMEIAVQKRNQLLEDANEKGFQYAAATAYSSVLVRLSKVLGLRKEHNPRSLSDLAEVILTPSGTDAEYLITMVAMVRKSALRGSQKKRSIESKIGDLEFVDTANTSCILNCITGAGEVGKNTARAAGGQYISTCTPMGTVLGPSSNGNNGAVPGFSCEDVEVVEFRLRSTKDCSVLGANDENAIAERIRHFLADYDDPGFNCDRVAVLHIVCCSKTGIVFPSNSIEFALSLREEVGSDRLLVAVDCCQFRCDVSFLQRCLQLEFMCIITGSKYFGGPPFSGAVLLPRALACEVETHAKNSLDVDKTSECCIPAGLAEFISHHEVSEGMPRLREFLEKLHAERNRKRSVDVSNIGTTATAVTGNINTENANNVPGDHVAAVNVGLLLRWECALARMEKYNEISITDQRLFVTKWNLFIRNQIAEKCHPWMELLEESWYDNDLSIDSNPKCSSILNLILYQPSDANTNTNACNTSDSVDSNARSHGNSNFVPLGLAECKRFYQHLVTVGHPKRIMIGQPVLLTVAGGENEQELCVVRLALGAEMVIDAAAGGSNECKVLEDDAIVIENMLQLLKDWNSIPV